MSPAQLIVFINALGVGDLALITSKLAEARISCEDLEQHELASKLAEASAALQSADLKTYRRNLETVVSRLGHLK